MWVTTLPEFRRWIFFWSALLVANFPSHQQTFTPVWSSSKSMIVLVVKKVEVMMVTVVTVVVVVVPVMIMSCWLM